MLVDDIADLLSTGGLGTVGANIWKGGMFGEADPAWAILAVGGIEPIRSMQSAAGMAPIERPRLQINVRSRSEETALRQAQRAYKLLDGMPERYINGIRYLWCAAIQPPFTSDIDESNRYIVSFNVDLMREKST